MTRKQYFLGECFTNVKWNSFTVNELLKSDVRWAGICRPSGITRLQSLRCNTRLHLVLREWMDEKRTITETSWANLQIRCFAIDSHLVNITLYISALKPLKWMSSVIHRCVIYHQLKWMLRTIHRCVNVSSIEMDVTCHPQMMCYV